ncbi:MAG TPA: hypothetical protein VJT50_06445 [Pyrinomonadaceae bacterium]|nr:hypothetical protein [Pyrinomonadaceae bacterium]
MYSIKSRSRLFGILLGLSLLPGIGLLSTTSVEGQTIWRQNQQNRDWERDRRDRDHDRDGRRDRDRDRRRDDDNYRRSGVYRQGGYGNYGYNVYQIAQQRGYQDGLYTGSNDARRGQSYNPQRSHFYRDADSGYSSSYGNRGQFRQAYRQGFLQGYRQGFQQNGGYNRNGTYNQRWPW